jgi:hypothetical protein
VSTAHKAKGREWNAVKLAGDFAEMQPSPSETRLRYVAYTRARPTPSRCHPRCSRSSRLVRGLICARGLDARASPSSRSRRCTHVANEPGLHRQRPGSTNTVRRDRTCSGTTIAPAAGLAAHPGGSEG